MNRLGVFQSFPSSLAFSYIFRVFQFLRTHPNVPLFYPNKPLSAEIFFEYHFSSAGAKDRLVVPHCLCEHVDISFAPNIRNKQSVSGHLGTMVTVTVAVDWNTGKQVTCASSATDGETRAYYKGGQLTVKYRAFLQQIGHLLHHPTPLLTVLSAN